MSDQNDPRPIPFQGTNYEYKVSIGTVNSAKSINWELHVNVTRWEDAQELAEMARSHYDYPVVEVQTDWQGDMP